MYCLCLHVICLFGFSVLLNLSVVVFAFVAEKKFWIVAPTHDPHHSRFVMWVVPKDVTAAVACEAFQAVMWNAEHVFYNKEAACVYTKLIQSGVCWAELPQSCRKAIMQEEVGVAVFKEFKADDAYIVSKKKKDEEEKASAAADAASTPQVCVFIYTRYFTCILLRT